MSKPREFWVSGVDLMRTKPADYVPDIHVIEYSEYEQACKERDALKAELETEKLSNDIYCTKINLDLHKLQAQADKLANVIARVKEAFPQFDDDNVLASFEEWKKK